MKKETEQKEDGRYIIFYTFEDEDEKAEAPADREHRTTAPDSP